LNKVKQKDSDKQYLVIYPEMGMAGDMFSSALISLGVPEEKMKQAMLIAAKYIGEAGIEVERTPYLEGSAVKLKINLGANSDHLLIDDARIYLNKILDELEITSSYRDFALKALEILAAAEREAHSNQWLNDDLPGLEVVGIARTPYTKKSETPYQPLATGDSSEESFYIEVFDQFQPGLMGLDSFSHLDVISFMHQSKGYSLTVVPPWQDDRGGKKQVGLFASRSPNRPSPLGLTLTKISSIEGNRIYTGQLDLFDGTPIVDIKPHIGAMDRKSHRIGNDGWLEGSDHLRLHKEGVPHRHSQEKTVLHEAQDILIDIIGAAYGLQYLGISLGKVLCVMPVSVGGGMIRFSHGLLPVPAPAVAAILKNYKIPNVSGPVESELLTPTGVAILAALQPEWQVGNDELLGNVGDRMRYGYGMGTKILELPNVLKLALINMDN